MSLPFQLKRDCCAICFTFQMEFRSGDQLVCVNTVCFFFFLYFVDCLSNEKCNLVSEFIYTSNAKMILFQRIFGAFPLVFFFRVLSNRIADLLESQTQKNPIFTRNECRSISHIVVRLIHNVSKIENFMKAKHSQ